MYGSLSAFVELLESRGELIRIKEFVDPLYEIAEVTGRVGIGAKALLFENTGTQYPVLTNMLGSEQRMLLALGAESYDSIGARFSALTKALSSPLGGSFATLKMLSTLKDLSHLMPSSHKGTARCQEVVQYVADLTRFPILRSWSGDSYRSIHSAIISTADPLTGKCHSSMGAVLVYGKDSCGISLERTALRHLGDCTHRLPVAICLGGDPVCEVASSLPLPVGVDAFMIAGFLRGKGVELVPCFTQCLMVPSDADIVLEGYIQKSEAPSCGITLGDHTGFYCSSGRYYTFHLSCITNRRDAILPAMVSGVPPLEISFLHQAQEHILLEPMKLALDHGIVDFHIPEEGAGHNFAFISIKKSYEGQPFKLANALWGSSMMTCGKFLVVVDENVNVRERKAVLEAIARNFSPTRDTLVSRGPVHPRGVGGKMCIDATSHTEHFEGRALSDVIRVVFDEEPSDLYHRLWLLGCNCDPYEDSRIEDGVLYLDARMDKAMPDTARGLSGIVSSSEAVREAIDLKWPLLGL